MAIKKKFVITYRHGGHWSSYHIVKRGGKPLYFRTKREGQRWIEEAKKSGELKSAVPTTVWECRKMRK